MVSKISFQKILESHFGSFRDYNSGQRSVSDIALFFVLPAIFGGLALLQCNLNKDILNSIITSASIFAGLLLNLLVLIYTLASKFNTDEVNWPTKKRLLEETFANISFSILISVLLVVACMLAFRTDEAMAAPISVPKYIADGVVYYLTGVLIMHLLMILKRIHTLVDLEF